MYNVIIFIAICRKGAGLGLYVGVEYITGTKAL